IISILSDQSRQTVLADINHFGALPVRAVATGCGESGSSRKKGIGFGGTDELLTGNMTPFSLLDDLLGNGEKQKWFKCPECGWQAKGPIGEGPCGGCGLTKDKYAGPKCA